MTDTPPVNAGVIKPQSAKRTNWFVCIGHDRKMQRFEGLKALYVGNGGAESTRIAKIIPKLDFIGESCKIRRSREGMLS